MDIRSQATLIFEKYNAFMERCSEEILESESATRDIFSEEFEAGFEAMVDARAAAFFDQSLDGLDAGSPKAFFGSLTNVDEAMEVFRIAAEVSDVGPPKDLTDRVFSLGEDAVDKMIALSLSLDWAVAPGADTLDERDILSPCTSAIRALGENHTEKSILPILNRYCQTKSPDDYISDVISGYLVNMGNLVTGELISRIDSAEILPANGPEEDLMVALAKIGAGHRSEAVFQSLRGAFRKIERKVIGALCLGDYGDGRAVPLLKGYLDRNLHTVSREMFYETLTVIRKLGGDINDIQDPFKDFSKK